MHVCNLCTFCTCALCMCVALNDTAAIHFCKGSLHTRGCSCYLEKKEVWDKGIRNRKRLNMYYVRMFLSLSCRSIGHSFYALSESPACLCLCTIPDICPRHSMYVAYEMHMLNVYVQDADKVYKEKNFIFSEKCIEVLNNLINK